MSSPPQPQAPKRLLDLLPAMYQEGDAPGQPSFLALFLRAFETLLFAMPATPSEGVQPDAAPRALEAEINALPTLLDPLTTPEEFLPWLASWAALSFHPDLSEQRRRQLLAHIIPLYRIRGTRRYIEDLLTLAVDGFIAVTDVEISGFRIGHHATVGMDTYLGGGPPHFFSVRLIAPGLDKSQQAQQLAIARSLLDLAKPAHTSYELALVSSRLQVGIHSSVGLDTVIAPAAQ